MDSSSITETGKVTAIDDDEAVITLEPQGGHKGCDHCGLCQNRGGRMIARVPRGDLRVGDSVKLRRTGPGIRTAIVFMQIIPLLALIAGGVVAHLLSAGSPWNGAIVAGAAIGSAMVAVVAVRLLSPSVSRGQGQRLEVVESWRGG